jgi:transcriptional regulator with XRE-family HTH domain
MAEEDYKKIFAKNLKYYMDLNGKNQMDLMNDLHLSSSTVSNWCTGLKLPRMDKVQMLADYFKINKSDLIEDKSNEPNDHYYLNDETRQIAQEAFENPELRTLFKVARDIPPERLKAHIEFMKSLKAQERGDNDEGC